MADNYKIKIILYKSLLEGICSLELFDQTKKFEGEIISFDLPKNKFSQFQINLPTKLFMKSQENSYMFNCTLNLLKGNSTYHFLSGKQVTLHELLFYDVETLTIIVDGLKINEYDCFGKFKRVSLINIKNYEIEINGNKIDLSHFRPIFDLKDNSFQYSFYDIEQRLIASKVIKPINMKDFSSIYYQNIQGLKEFSDDISLIKTAESLDKKFSDLNKEYPFLYLGLLDELNLVLPNKILQNILNKNEYVYFFYYFAKLKIFFLLYYSEDKNFDLFEKIYKNLNDIFSNLIKDANLICFEKISILMSYTELFSLVESPKIFVDIKFEYIKLDLVEKNSIIHLSCEFINKYIDNLTENSPSYFSLVELNSDFGFYNEEIVFSYDIVCLSDLKSHLREIIPTVISFFELKNSDKNAFTDGLTGAIGINKVTLLNPYKDLDITKNILNKSKYDAKDAAMKLAEDIMHESFGHKKLKLKFDFYEKDNRATPKKCFKDKKLKELVIINQINHEKNINILFDKEKSDSGNYFESSFGRLANTKYYTFTYLSRIKHGKLIDYPELFYNRNNLETLQKYAYYRFLYFKSKDKDEKNESENLNLKNIEELNELSLSDEIDYLSKFARENFTEEKNIKTENNPIDNTKIFHSDAKKFIGKKRVINFGIETLISSPDENKKKPLISLKKLSRKELLNKIANPNLSYEQRRFYFKCFTKRNLKI